MIRAPPPPMPPDRLESVKSICGNVFISRSRTIAKCCGCWRSFPRIHSSRVILSNLSSLTRELHGHDRRARRAGARVEVRPRTRELEILARHLRHVRRVVLEEVVVRAIGRHAAPLRPAGTNDRALSARDHHHALGYRTKLAAGREFSAGLPKRVRLRPVWARDDPLRRRVDDVVLGRRSVLRLRLHLRQQLVERHVLDRLAANRDGRADERGLEVVELELRGRADDLCSRLGVLDAGELNHDLVVALSPDLGLGDAELVDPIPHDVDRPVEILLREVAVRRRDGLEGDLEAPWRSRPRVGF